MSSTLFLRSAGLIALMIALQLTQVVSATEAKKPNRRCINVGENLEGSRGVDELTAMVVDSFRKSDFRGVEGYAADWGDLSCIWKDGRPRLSAIEYGLSRAISQEPDWLKTEAMITQYRQQYPESPIAVMAEVEFWTNYAWKARGTGYELPEISSAKGDVKLTLRFMHAVQGNVLAPAQPLFRLPVLN